MNKILDFENYNLITEQLKDGPLTQSQLEKLREKSQLVDIVMNVFNPPLRNISVSITEDQQTTNIQWLRKLKRFLGLNKVKQIDVKFIIPTQGGALEIICTPKFLLIGNKKTTITDFAMVISKSNTNPNEESRLDTEFIRGGFLKRRVANGWSQMWRKIPTGGIKNLTHTNIIPQAMTNLLQSVQQIISQSTPPPNP